jgi:Tol biopolymer transport system component
MTFTKIQWLIVVSAALAGCAAGRDSAPDSAMPILNAEALQVCEPLQRFDFAFTSNAAGENDIYLFEARTASVTRLTDSEAEDHWATWSRDGRMLAFQSLRDGNREIYIQVLPGGIPVNASQHEEQDLVPAWSPNNNYLVFYSSRDVTWAEAGPIGGNLFVMRVQGSVLGRIQTEPFHSPTMVAWSPDSGTLFYARYGEGKEGIYSLNLATGQETALLALDGRFPGIASTYPAQDTVDYYVNVESGVAIYQLNLLDGTSRKLSPDRGLHYYASWSPDRSALLITSARDATGQSYNIRCVAADGSYDVPVINGASDARSAAWRPGVH